MINNAIKFTHEGGRIDIFIHEIAIVDHFKEFSISVKDNGIGMTKEFQERMYQAFEQEDNRKTGNEEGTGLGLTIVKKIVDLMNAKIECISERNIGTEFIVSFVAESVDQDEVLSIEKVDSKNQKELLQGKKLLIVEDHPLNVLVVQKILSRFEVITQVATNGIEAIQILESSKINEIDLILMDVRMPILDGIEATKRIRKMLREDIKGIPIIALTADAYQEDEERIYECGMNAFLTKPINSSIFIELLCEILKK